MRRVIKTKNRWTAAQLELLCDVWEKYYPSLKVGRGNEEIYGLMVRELQEEGFLDATVKDIRGRIHNLSGKFRKEANRVAMTGEPSQWLLYSKIEKFFEYEIPVEYKSVDPPVYDMCEYLDVNIEMADTIASHQSHRERQASRQAPTEAHAIDDELMDFAELEELNEELNEESVEKELPPEQEVLAEEVVIEHEDAASMVAEEPPKAASASNQPDDKPTTEQDPPTRTEPKQPEADKSNDESDESADDTDGTDSDSSFDFELPVSPSSKSPQHSQVFHFNGSYRHAAMESFLSQLYSNQLYADVMLITCNDGVTCVMPAHRMVLANFSEFFSSILGALKPNTNGSPLTVLLQPDISQPVMQLLLQFMYTGKVSVTQELIGDFLRCGHVLRVRGVWSEEKEGSSDVERPVRTAPSKRQPASHSDSEGSAVDEFDRSTVTSVPQASTASNASEPKSVSSSTQEFSDADTLTPHERPTQKRRNRKLNKIIKRMRYSSDDELDEVEVSSNVGFDLLRSDSETEEGDRVAKRDKELEGKGVAEDKEETEDGKSIDDRDTYDDYDDDEEDEDDDDEDDEDDDSQRTEDEKDEDDDFDEEKSLYIDTGDDDMDTDFDGNSSIVNGKQSVSNPSTAITTPEPTAAARLQTISANDDGVDSTDPTKRPANSNNNNNARSRSESREVSVHEESTQANDGQDRLAREPAITIKTKVKLPLQTSEVRRALQTIPACTSVQQLSSHKQPHSPPEQLSQSQLSPSSGSSEKQSTSRKQFVPSLRPWYGCRICGKRYPLSEEWLQHVVYQHASDERLMNGENNPDARPKTILRCDLCGKCLSTKYDWVQHIVRKHTERYPHFHEELSMSDD
uniref:BTB domain-containing protein n=1 Tax=Anopheles coluzzii TaxID=1518534 RepID=A0A6E8VMV2_ANOCL|nr:protein tramtrack, beta isoform-like [Anopheles coluzzii]